MSFSKLGLNEALQRTIAQLGYTTPTPIQAQAIPVVLDGRDLLAAAQTGTGKTAAFTLPLLERLQNAGQSTGHRTPRALVLTPTRELAAQVAASVAEYGAGSDVRTTCVFGGVSPQPQLKAFRRGVDVLIATPGRLLDHVEQGNVDLSKVEVFILDEADRMLDMGFIHDIRRVIKRLPNDRQNLLFSATFSNEIRQLAKGFLNNAAEINVAPPNATTELVEQKMVFVPKHQKRELLSWLIGSNNWKQVLVFTRTKHGANRLCEQLTTDGLPAAALHGNKSQSARTKALQGFKDNRVRVLVATDIAARGLDIDQLPHVINYELPNVPADYVHRIGRTGRAGVEGEALSLVSMDERTFLKDINKLLGQQIPELKIEGFLIKEDKGSPDDNKKAPGGRGRGKPGGNRGRGNQNNSRGKSSQGKPRGANSGRSNDKGKQGGRRSA